MQPLPVSSPSALPQPGDETPVATESPKLPPVLVVDDDSEIREALMLALEEAGYTVYEAADGQMALSVLRSSERCMVVLVDQLMPRLEGTDFVRIATQESETLTRHRYVLMTASPRLLAAESLAELAAVEVPVLAKPFNLDDVLALVARAAHCLASAA